jgi:membrane associated rhomboid family serine protease
VIEDFFADKRHAGMQTSISYEARTNNPDRISAFFAAPMRDSAFVFPHRKSDIWLGIKYTESIKNRHNRAAMEEECQRFARSAISRFNDENLESFSYFERAGNNEDRQSIEAAIRKSDLYDSLGPQVVLVGQYEPFQSRNGNKLAWAFGVFGAGSAVWFLMLLFPRLDDEELRRIRRGRPSQDKDLKETLGLFRPQLGFYVTPIIMGVNILVFLAMVLAGLGVASFRTSDLLNWGANYSLLVRQGQWFRLVTSMFVHGGLFHLAMNTYGLLFAGLFLESMLGTGKFAFAYLFTGITASIVSILVHPNTVTLGASGAIFGLYGVLLVLLFVKDFGRALTKDPLLINIAIFIGVNLLIGSLAIGIDNAAHVGGLLSGILLGAFFCLAVSNAGAHRSIMMASRQVRAKTSTLPR